MNDIEVLIKHKNDYDIALGTKIYRPYSMSVEDWEVIENLLKERQSDKEKIEELEENYSILEKAYFTDSIPKSLIKEKIEPVINNLERDGFVGYADELRDIISELMEGK